MINFSKTFNNKNKIFALFKEDSKFSSLKIKSKIKENVFYDFIEPNITFIYLGEKEKYNQVKLEKTIKYIALNSFKEYDIDLKSFVTSEFSESLLLKFFLSIENKWNQKPFNLKTKKRKEKNFLTIVSKSGEKIYEEQMFYINQINEIRKLQDAPSNILSTPVFAKKLKSLFDENKKIKTTIFSKNDLRKKGMNLILSVNGGSKNDAKMVVAEYKGNPGSKDKVVIIGKGIIFDSGGYNIKIGRGMLGMKYDMSGAAIAAYVLDSIAKLKVKINLSVVLPITDNLVSEGGTLPESIFKSYQGRTVEIADTDAEGRLIMADALTFGAKDLKATLLIDIATLTGSVMRALGTKRTGIWSTSDDNFFKLEKASQNQIEKVWRMPFDPEYIDHLRENTRADILSCSKTNYSDCNIAAAWLNEFCLGKEHLHIDIAGTGDDNFGGNAPMLKTLVEFLQNY